MTFELAARSIKARVDEAMEARKRERPAPLLEAGRYGFMDYGKRIQDAILQRGDPQQKALQEARERKKILGEIKAEIIKGNQKKQEAGGLVGPT